MIWLTFLSFNFRVCICSTPFRVLCNAISLFSQRALWLGISNTVQIALDLHCKELKSKKMMLESLLLLVLNLQKIGISYISFHNPNCSNTDLLYGGRQNEWECKLHKNFEIAFLMRNFSHPVIFTLESY